MAFQLLVADDSATMRKAVEYTFAGQDYAITAVADAASAVRVVQQNHPDLAIIDVHMPDADGYSVCAQLKNDANTAHIPVILLGTINQDKAKKSGANGHVHKPFTTQALIAEVRRLLAPVAQSHGPLFHQVPPAVVKKAPIPIHRHAPARVSQPVQPIVTEPAATAATPTPSTTTANPSPTLAAAAPIVTSITTAAPVLPLPDELGAAGIDQTVLLQMTREIIEQVAWEVVPKMAETMLREHIQRIVQK